MELAALIRSRRLALLATLAGGLVLAAAVYTALFAPGNLGLSVTTTGRAGAGADRGAVTWVMPNGVAWGAGVRAGDAVIGRTAHGIVVRAGGQRVVLGRHSTAVAPVDLLVAALGLCLLLLGAAVLIKSRDQATARVFWRTSLAAGVALGTVPAGFHGALWAIVLTFVALRLFGPAFFELALAFPTNESARLPYRAGWMRAVVWAPALALLPLYPLCWAHPIPWFDLLLNVDDLVLACYLVATVAWVVAALFRPRSAAQRAQLQYLAVGLICGLAPIVVLTLLPSILTGDDLVPGQVSILALVLFPASIGMAIVRTEFLGMTSLVRRRTLRLALGAAILTTLATVAWLAVAVGARRLHWPAPAIAAFVALLAGLCAAPLHRALARRAERFFLRDAYDTAGTLLDLSATLSRAAPHEVGPLTVTRLGAVLDLSFALLVTTRERHYHAHPRGSVPETLRAAAEARAEALLASAVPAAAFVERVQDVPVLLLPVLEGQQAVAALCLGPKRSGDRYTAQDRALLGALCRHLAVLMHNERLRGQVDRQITLLREIAAERAALTERVLNAVEEERQRLAGILHDEAIQMGGEVARQLDDLLADPDVPLDLHVELAAVADLSAEVVTRLREVAGQLYPPPLRTAGLAPALQALLRDAERQRGCRCLLDVDPALALARLSPEHEVALYHIAREAIGNALRHADARTIRVALCLDGERLSLTVCDDGAGFTAQPIGDLLAAGHLGLALMQQRARDLGGTLEMSAVRGGGATVTARVPVAITGAEEVRA